MICPSKGPTGGAGRQLHHGPGRPPAAPQLSELWSELTEKFTNTELQVNHNRAATDIDESSVSSELISNVWRWLLQNLPLQRKKNFQNMTWWCTQTLYYQGLLGTYYKSAGFALSTLYLSELLKCFLCRSGG